MGVGELVAIASALAALVVAITSLYTTVLKPADIWLDREPFRYELSGRDVTDGVPRPRLRLLLTVANLGANAAYLSRIRITNFQYIGADPKLWNGVDAVHAYRTRDDDFGLAVHVAGESELPILIGPGDAEFVWLYGLWEEGPSDFPVSLSTDERLVWYATRISGFTAVQFDLEWEFRRLGGSQRFPFGEDGETERVTRCRTVRIDSDRLRNFVETKWASNQHWQNRIDLLRQPFVNQQAPAMHRNN